TRYSYSIQIPSANPRNFNRSDRTWLRIFHLDEKDPVRLAGLRCGDAYCHRSDHGNVSFRAGDDRVESCRVRRRSRICGAKFSKDSAKIRAIKRNAVSMFGAKSRKRSREWRRPGAELQAEAGWLKQSYRRTTNW